MKRPICLVQFVVLAAGSIGFAHADDGILLSVARGASPADASVSWTGNVPNFDVYRSAAAGAVTIPGNLVTVTGTRNVTDTGVPPAGTCLFYAVVSVGPCAPLSPSTICGAGERCFPTEDHLTSCSGPVGSATECGACASHDTCAATYACISSGTNKCMQWCRIGFSDCTAGFFCAQLFPSIYAGTQEYGVCAC